MFDLIVTGLIAAPAIQLAADIATWCFNAGAESQRARQRAIICSTRAELASERSTQRQIDRETWERIAEERRAAHQAHYEMLGGLWNSVQDLKNSAWAVLRQFQNIRDQNCLFLQSLALIPEQRAAIHECNDQLERGIQRLRAYLEPYLQYYFGEIHAAQIALRTMIHHSGFARRRSSG